MKYLDKYISCVARCFSAIAVLVVFAGELSAQTETILIGPGVRNGDFNDDASATDQRNYSATPAWTNIGTGFNQNSIATRTNLDYDGSRNHLIDELPSIIAAQDTGYTIADGDYFRVTYVWRDAWNWDANGQVAVRLFTTDTGLIDGVATDFATLLSGKADPLDNSNTNYESVVGSVTASASEAGRRLFVAIDTTGDNDSGYARLDNFQLSVRSGGVIFYSSFEQPDISSDANGYSDIDPTGWTVPQGGGMNHEKCGTFSTPYGAQALWLNSSNATTTASILSDSLKKNHRYTLTFNIGRRSNLTARDNSYIASLLAGSTTLVSTNGAPTTSDFSESVELVFTPDDSHTGLIGEMLAIRFAIDTDYQPHFDNVMLLETPLHLGTTFRFR